MTPVVENGQIVLTSTAEHRQVLRTSPYTVADLTGGDAQAAADLAALVQRLVVPESWQASGGRGTRGNDARRPADHANRARPLPDPRLLREAPRRPRPADEEPFGSEEVRSDHADRAGEGHPGPGRRACNVSAAGAAGEHPRSVQAAGGNARFSSTAPRWRRPGFRRTPPCKFKADKLPQGEALGKLLEPLGLAWRAVDANTLQVTTQKAVAARMELEFYPVGKLLAGQPPAALIERIKTGLPAQIWGEGGGRRDLFRPALAMSDRAAIAAGAKGHRGLAGGKSELNAG